MRAPDGFEHVPRKGRARVKLRHQDARYRKPRIQPCADELVRVHEVPQTLQREVLALGGDQHAGGRDQGVEGQEAQRWRAVDENDLHVRRDGAKRRAK